MPDTIDAHAQAGLSGTWGDPGTGTFRSGGTLVVLVAGERHRGPGAAVAECAASRGCSGSWLRRCVCWAGRRAARGIGGGRPGPGVAGPLVAWACPWQRAGAAPLAGTLVAWGLPGLRWEMARRGEGAIVAAGAWTWPAGGVRAARRRGRLREVSGAVTVAALGVRAAAAWWRCRGWPGAGWGAAR